MKGVHTLSVGGRGKGHTPYLRPPRQPNTSYLRLGSSVGWVCLGIVLCFYPASVHCSPVPAWQLISLKQYNRTTVRHWNIVRHWHQTTLCDAQLPPVRHVEAQWDVNQTMLLSDTDVQALLGVAKHPLS